MSSTLCTLQQHFVFEQDAKLLNNVKLTRF